MPTRGLRRTLLAIAVGVPLFAQTGSIVISQIYGGGGNMGATLRADFVELFNRGSQPVDIGGWTLQYASAAGTTWDRTFLSGTIQPGHYYLLQMAVGGPGVSLPSPDAIGELNLSAMSAKIALVAGLANLSDTVPSSPQLVDFVGYGTANAALGSPAPQINNTTAILRRSNGCTDTRNNSADFVTGSPSPRTSRTAPNYCFALPAISTAGIANAASFAAESVAPGEILTIFGSAMGPALLQRLQLNPDGRSVSNSLSGTRVLFNGVPGPLIYTRTDQVSVIVPYGVATSATVEIQVEYNGVPSNRVTLPVAKAAPGIFTLDSSGRGQGAILNQDYFVNGPSRPASIGSVIIIYATGAGRTNPPAPDGGIIGTPLPLVQETVTVKIDGQDAEVLYAGMAPSLVNGVLQINARIPSGLARGGSLPIEVSVGGRSAQSGVTVAVQNP